MICLSIHLPEALAERLEEAALRRRTGKEDLLLELLRDYLATDADGPAAPLPGEGPREASPSCHDLARHLAGSVEGTPDDLAANPAHLNGYGR